MDYGYQRLNEILGISVSSKLHVGCIEQVLYLVILSSILGKGIWYDNYSRAGAKDGDLQRLHCQQGWGSYLPT